MILWVVFRNEKIKKFKYAQQLILNVYDSKLKK